MKAYYGYGLTLAKHLDYSGDCMPSQLLLKRACTVKLSVIYHPVMVFATFAGV